MGQGYQLDTNVVIDFCGGKLPSTAMQKMQEITDSGFSVSVIVQIEVLGFNGLPVDMQRLQSFLSFANMLYVTDEVIQSTIHLRKSNKIKLGDAIIAATAIVYKHSLITRNTKDFINLPGLTVIDPFTF